MDAQKEKEFRFRLRLEREQAGQQAPSSEEQSFAQEQFGNESPTYNPLNMGGMMAGSVGASGTQPGAAMPVAGQMIGNMIPNPVLSAVGGVAGAMAGEGLRNMVGKALRVNDSKSVLEQMVAKGKSAAVAEGAGLALNGFLNMAVNTLKPTANKMMNSIMNPSKAVMKKSPNLGTDVLNRGVYGNPQKIREQASSYIENSEAQLQTILGGRAERVSMNPFKINIGKKIDTIHDAADKNALKGVIEDWVEPYSQSGYQVDVGKANEIKREIYKKLGDRYYLSTITNEKKTALEDLARHLKNSIEEAVPLEPIKEINQGMSVMIKARNSVDDVLALSNKKSGFGFSDLAFGSLGAMMGRGNGVLENMTEAIATATLARVLGSKTLRGNLAAGMNALPKETTKQAIGTARKIATPLVTSVAS